MTSETIFALSSAPGRAGVAVLRVSGREAATTLSRMTGECPAPRRANVTAIHHPITGDPIDRGLVLFFAAPASFTGEDVAEFQVHGGRAVVEAMLVAFGALDGLRPAQPGEFTRRAFDNGKLDLTRVEALAALIDAETEAQRQTALAHLDGHLNAKAVTWRATIVEAMALIEAGLDFSDEEDVGQAELVPRAQALLAPLLEELAREISGAHRGEILRDGFRVAIAGPVNAGKSSLLNALARRDVAIVSNQPGTTRDVIEVRLDLGGIPIVVSDTAGLRDEAAAVPVEREGIARALRAVAAADLTIWLSPVDAPSLPPSRLVGEAQKPLLVVTSKIDLAPGNQQSATLGISTQVASTLEPLLALITERARLALGDGTPPAILTARHLDEFRRCAASLEAFVTADDTALPELLAEELRSAAEALGRLLGRVDVEEVLDRLFRGFCIGK